MKENQRLVTIARFENSFEAQMAKLLLEEEGIHAVILGETLGTSFPDVSKLDFVELQVFEEDRITAEKILEEKRVSGDEEDEEESL